MTTARRNGRALLKPLALVRAAAAAVGDRLRQDLNTDGSVNIMDMFKMFPS